MSRTQADFLRASACMAAEERVFHITIDSHHMLIAIMPNFADSVIILHVLYNINIYKTRYGG